MERGPRSLVQRVRLDQWGNILGSMCGAGEFPKDARGWWSRGEGVRRYGSEIYVCYSLSTVCIQ